MIKYIFICFGRISTGRNITSFKLNKDFFILKLVYQINNLIIKLALKFDTSHKLHKLFDCLSFSQEKLFLCFNENYCPLGFLLFERKDVDDYYVR